MTKTRVLSVGTVLVERYGFDGMALEKIVRVTPTQAVTSSGKKYRLADGGEVGGYGTAQIATDEHYAEMRHRKLEREVMALLPTRQTLRAMTEDRLTAIRDLLTTEKPA